MNEGLAHVVSTRIQPPAQPSRLIARGRLIDRLHTGQHKRLTLIQGPAGFGKTTLALQWHDVLRSANVPTAWLSLDRDDGDINSFLAHLIAAVRRALPILGNELEGYLEHSHDNSGRRILAELVNQISESHQRLAVIVDDWHLIDNRGTADALEFLTEFGPDTMHLIVTSRTRAPAIGRLKMRDEVNEIRSADLRFDYRESSAFLVELNALDLDGDEIEQLWSTTEGWVAALQLASLSLRNANDPSALISGFTGRHRSIGDYLTENVLNALPGELYDFLVTTSICDRLCGDLARAVSGQPRGQAILEELERRDMFLKPLDDDREWFRYHHLFAEYLRQRLERKHPDEVEDLHRTASKWFAQHGFLGESVRHALAAGDAEHAVLLVEEQAMHLIEHSRMSTLLGLVNKLPQWIVNDRPTLQIAIGWANCLLQRAPEVQTALDHVRAVLRSPCNGAEFETLGEADVVQACTDVYRDRIDRASELVAPHIGENPRGRPFLVAVSANIRTFVDIHTFAYDAARARQRWATRYHDAAVGPFAGVYGRSFAGLAASAQLDLADAERHYSDAFALGRKVAGERSHAARLAGALLGSLQYERGQIDTAEKLLEDCHDLGAESGVVDFMIATYLTLARIKVIRGDVDHALGVLEEGKLAAQRLSLPRLSAALDHEYVRVYLAVGDTERAQRTLDCHSVAMATGTDGISMAIRHYQTRMKARLLCARHDFAAAYRSLSAIRDEAGAAGWRHAEIVDVLELARAKAVHGDTVAATELLTPALQSGERSGLMRTLIDAGPELLTIVAELRDKQRTGRWPAGMPQISSDYLSGLLVIAHGDAATGAIPSITRPAGRLPIAEEPLNAREVAILGQLGLGLSNKQIARNLDLAIDTVKWHLKNLYIKLSVASRGAAVAEARRRQILP